MQQDQQSSGHEKEFSGPLWKHPYVIYIWITAILFAILLFAGWLALSNGWIPERGTVSTARVSSFDARRN
ncbi:hypothetical protein K2X30_02190 [bacterium]|nr:hypothetical protein [bacterium]